MEISPRPSIVFHSRGYMYCLQTFLSKKYINTRTPDSSLYTLLSLLGLDSYFSSKSFIIPNPRIPDGIYSASHDLRFPPRRLCPREPQAFFLISASFANLNKRKSNGIRSPSQVACCVWLRSSSSGMVFG